MNDTCRTQWFFLIATYWNLTTMLNKADPILANAYTGGLNQCFAKPTVTGLWRNHPLASGSLWVMESNKKDQRTWVLKANLLKLIRWPKVNQKEPTVLLMADLNHLIFNLASYRTGSLHLAPEVQSKCILFLDVFLSQHRAPQIWKNKPSPKACQGLLELSFYSIVFWKHLK